ncbi:MAG: PAS domain S-box protein [Actinobacteria bacterium]|nr:PAS domain S-box protein [Actinomycetota bacterium]MCA1738778.1 PAS domain S-box protein [Actinomycetota bacterium]
MRDGVIVADAKTQRIVLWNSAATNIFGYSPSEALRMRVEDLVPERFRAQHRAGIARYHETGRGPYIDANKLLDLPAVTRTGKEIRVELSLSPLEPVDDSSGLLVLAIVRDITERNRVEELAAQLLRHLSGELVSESNTTVPDLSLEHHVPLQEAQKVELTAREMEILRLLTLGRTNRQIAQEMLVSLSSVKAYVGRVIDKLGVSDRTQAAVRAVELALLPEQQK